MKKTVHLMFGVVATTTLHGRDHRVSMVVTIEYPWFLPRNVMFGPTPIFSPFSAYFREAYKREHNLGIKGGLLVGNNRGNMP